MIRMISIVMLLLHFYFYTYSSFRELGLTSELADTFLVNLGRTGLFNSFLTSKMTALLLLCISLVGARGKKEPGYTPLGAVQITGGGLCLYFGSAIILYLDFPVVHLAILYILLCAAGYLLLLRGGNYISRVIWTKSPPDIFNRLHESFP